MLKVDRLKKLGCGHVYHVSANPHGAILVSDTCGVSRYTR